MSGWTVYLEKLLSPIFIVYLADKQSHIKSFYDYKGPRRADAKLKENFKRRIYGFIIIQSTANPWR